MLSTEELLSQLNNKEVRLYQQHSELHLQHQYNDQEEVQILRANLKAKIDEVNALYSSVVKLQQLLWKKSDVPLYDMKQTPHGLAVLIINENFSPNHSNPRLILNHRKGAKKDEEHFLVAFKFLQYAVQVYTNLCAADMALLMHKMGQTDHSQYDSFVCCVSSHGNQMGIYGSDSTHVNRAAFINPIKSCDSLLGKPKMFFFQACRTAAVDADSIDVSLPVPALPLHPDSDILIANASTEGNPAYTSPQTGSWFASAVKQKLTQTQLVHTRTLQQLLEEVADLVSTTKGQLLQNGEPVQQCVEITTTMRKGIKF